VRVLIFHGYLLRGTGSNVYNANLAQALARLGHEVHLLCQDLEAASLPWIDAVGTWEDGELRVHPTSQTTPAGVTEYEMTYSATPAGAAGGHAGRITAYTPDIGGLLPTYVADSYEGFEARTFPELGDEEVEAYIEANVGTVSDVAAAAGGIDAALANHLVMGPVILARAGLPFAAKVHGSALSYTVIPNPRFLAYAREGMAAASAVLVGSRHTAEALWETVADPSLPAKTRLGPPGVDVRAFSPLAEGETAAVVLEDLAADIEDGDQGGAFGRDPAAAVAALRRYAGAEGPRVIFVGKLIVSKGIDLLLAAWPLVTSRNPGAELLLIGFGEYREGALRLWEALAAGDLDAARGVAAQGRGLEGGEEAPLPYLEAFLADPPAGYAEAARHAAGSAALAGRLEYGEVARAVRASDAMVVPSTFPEAFGMVAAEAAATGALPVCARHSGLAEVAGALAEAMPEGLGELTAFDLGPGAPAAIAERLNRWLALGAGERDSASASLAAAVRARWSWEKVAESVPAASEGALGRLDPVPSD
jgi:glycosyltransferase involved in cell wall biosynthesis